jgi:MFS family permease
MKEYWRRLRRLPRNVFAIGLISFFNDASSEIIYPLLPAFLAVTLGASPSAIGLIEGGAESASSLLKLFSGYWSDRIGRRKGLVVTGYGVAWIARSLLAFAANWPQAFALRLADRFGKGVRGAPRDAMIADAAEPADRGFAFGFHRAMDHAGAVVGPLIALLLLYVIPANPSAPTSGDYTRIFLWAAVPGYLALMVAIFFLLERRAVPMSQTTRPRLSLAGFDGNFRWFLVVVALFTLSNSSDAFLLLRAQSTGIATTTLPLLWAALHVSKVIFSLAGGHLSDRIGRKRLIVSGWLLYAIVYAGFAFATSATSVWALFLVYGAYFGLAEGAEKALVVDLVRPEQRGTAFGLYNLAFGITVLPASQLMGAMWELWGPETAFLVSAGLGVLAALLMLTVKTGIRNPESEIRIPDLDPERVTLPSGAGRTS